jgi:hypothetical protein
MNCIPSLVIGLICLAACPACNAPASESDAPADPRTYRVEYDLRPDPASGTVAVALELTQARSLLRELTFRPDARTKDFEADGDLRTEGSAVHWYPPEKGGTLSWRVDVPHRRDGDGYDAWLGSDWGLFRAEDVIPRAASRTLKGAVSETWLGFSMPRSWSAVTQYFDKQGRFRVDNAKRRFDQPSGWIVVGDLGVRRETISGIRVAVAGPTGQSIRRMDILALLNWTLPELARVLPELPARLTIVSAGEPMWRGGLSAPQSLYLHSERPLISENATSTLLHEVMHISLGLSSQPGFDWIIEGLAEYYSLELLYRSSTISEPRYRQAREDIAAWSQDAATLCRPISSGATTARAVVQLAAVDAEIRKHTDGKSSLDDLASALWHIEEDIGLVTLTKLAEEIAGNKLDALHIDKLPGCRTIAAGELTN